jgi:hypothetical protein
MSENIELGCQSHSLPYLSVCHAFTWRVFRPSTMAMLTLSSAQILRRLVNWRALGLDEAAGVAAWFVLMAFVV